MTSTALALPMTGDSNTWTEQEKALVKAAGLVRSEGRGDSAREFLADRPTVEAFLAHCRRTGLDPIARQIYAIYRGGKWGIQISIDGARLVAERTGRYEGQTPTQWTDDGVTWVDVWLKDSEPRAARVGVFRAGFREPLYAVANWDSYVVTKDEWKDGRRTGNVIVSDMWQKFGPLMLGKCAEMLALRKAFPQDLSGLYSTEEMAQATGEPAAAPPAAPPPPRPVEQPEEDDRDWEEEIAAVETVEALTDLYRDAQTAGAFARVVDVEAGTTVEAALWARKSELERAPQAVVDVESEAEKPRDWADEAKALLTSAKVKALYQEALAVGAPEKAVEAIADRAAELDTQERGAEKGGDWAPAEPTTSDEWSGDEPAAGAEAEK